MIPVDLSANCDGWIYDRTDPGSRSLGSDPGIHFRDPRTCLDCSARLHQEHGNAVAAWRVRNEDARDKNT